MKLRATQIAVLKAVARHDGESTFGSDRGPGAAPATVASTLGRNCDSAEESLAKLEEAGYVRALFYPRLTAVYVLTDKGRQAVEGDDG
jgi:DNA-binding MarR family transcriptional regulator